MKSVILRCELLRASKDDGRVLRPILRDGADAPPQDDGGDCHDAGGNGECDGNGGGGLIGRGGSRQAPALRPAIIQ